MSVDPIASTPAAGHVSSLAEKRLAAVSLGSVPKGLSNLSQAEQAKAVAGQFEAIMLRQFLQESVGQIMGGDKGGPSGSIYGYLLTDVLSSRLAEGGGMGLAKIMQQQLTPRAPVHPAVAPLPGK
jgi:flagellar protein FlgJ